MKISSLIKIANSCVDTYSEFWTWITTGMWTSRSFAYHSVFSSEEVLKNKLRWHRRINFKSNDQFYFQWAFKLYDVDGNGVIDQCETVQVMTAILELVRPNSSVMMTHVMQSMFTSRDQDRDDFLSLSEFLHTCTNNSDIRTILLPLV